MKVISGRLITPSLLYSSSVAEPDITVGEVLWNAGTSYVVGQRCIRVETHRVYECSAAGVHAGPPELTSTRWLDVKPTNRYAMFDAKVSSSTVAEEALEVVIKPGYIGALSLLNVSGAEVEVTMRNGAAGPIVKNLTRSLEGRLVRNYYEYYFEPRVPIRDLTIADMPAYRNGHVTVRVTGPGQVGIGAQIVGPIYTLGSTQFGLQFPLRSYSRVIRNEFGDKEIVDGLDSADLSATFIVPNVQLKKVMSLLRSLIGKPCVFIGAPSLATADIPVYGFMTDCGVSVEMETESVVNVTVEGFT